MVYILKRFNHKPGESISYNIIIAMLSLLLNALSALAINCLAAGMFLKIIMIITSVQILFK